MSAPLPIPTPGPLVVIEQFPDTTLDLMYNILLALGGSQIDIEQKYYDTGDDLLYAILKRIVNGGIMAPGTETSRLISGYVSWSHDLVFDVTACVYFIAGVPYLTDPTQITLNDGDATHDRIDVFYVDDQQNVGVLQGVPAADPLKPQVDPETQLELSFVLVKAGAVVAEMREEIIYREHLNEWIATCNGGVLATNFDDPANPQEGLKNIAVYQFEQFDYLHFIRETIVGQLLQASDFSFLKFWINLNLPYDEPVHTGNFSLQAYFMNGSDVVAGPVQTSGGIGGFSTTADKNNVWQLVTIPFSHFAFTTQVFDSLKFVISGGTVNAFKLDNIVLQGPVVNVGTSEPSRFGLEDNEAEADEERSFQIGENNFSILAYAEDRGTGLHINANEITSEFSSEEIAAQVSQGAYGSKTFVYNSETENETITTPEKTVYIKPAVFYRGISLYPNVDDEGQVIRVYDDTDSGYYLNIGIEDNLPYYQQLLLPNVSGVSGARFAVAINTYDHTAGAGGKINIGQEEYVSNEAALLAGKPIGFIYRTGDILKIVHL